MEPIFYLQVKFYPPEPALLQEDLTRYVYIWIEALDFSPPTEFLTRLFFLKATKILINKYVLGSVILCCMENKRIDIFYSIR